MYKDTRLIVHTFLLNLIMNRVTGGSHSDKIVATTLYFRQNGNVQQPPRYSGPQRPGPASLQTPGVRSGQVNGAPPPGHAPYHASNTFSSPLSALLGTGSHYLFNSESKGPTVQIF